MNSTTHRRPARKLSTASGKIIGWSRRKSDKLRKAAQGMDKALVGAIRCASEKRLRCVLMPPHPLVKFVEPEVQPVIENLKSLIKSKHACLGTPFTLSFAPSSSSCPADQIKYLRESVDKLINLNNALLQENGQLRKALVIAAGASLVHPSSPPPSPRLVSQHELTLSRFVWPPSLSRRIYS